MPQDDQDRQVSLDEWEKLTFEKYGVPENLRQSIVGQESGGDVNAKSPTGVSGRYQVTKSTAAQYGYDRDDQWQQPVAAAKHLRTLYDGVKKRHPDFDDKTAWLGASAEYYYGGNAFDKDGNLSDQSRDGYSTPAKYARSIAEKWSAFDKGQGVAPAEGMNFNLNEPPVPRQPRQAPAEERQMSMGLLPGMKATRPQNTRRNTDESARRNAAPAIRAMIADFEGFKRQGDLGAARSIASEIKKQHGQWMDVGEENGQPVVRSKVAGWNPVQPKAGPASNENRVDELERRTAQEEYNRQPWLERRKRNIATGYEQGAQGLADMVHRGYDVARNAVSGNFAPLKEQAEGAGRGLLKLASAFDPVNAEETYRTVSAEQDPALVALERRRAERLKDDPYTIGSNVINARLAEEAERQPGFMGGVTRGVVSGGLQAGPYLAAGVLGGGIPTMGTLAAAQSDWVRPEEAALNVAGATLPIKVGRMATPAINRVAGQLPGRALPAATRAGGQVGIGAGTNVATALASGERDPMKLAETAAAGGITAGIDAVTAARGAKTPSVAEATSGVTAGAGTPVQPINGVRVFRQGEQIPARARNERQMPMDITKPDGSVETVMAVAPRGMKEGDIRQAAEQSLATPAADQQVAPPVTGPAEQLPPEPTAELTARIPDAQDTQQFRTPEGAIIAPLSSLPSRKLFGPAATQVVQTPNAPATRQIPGVARTPRAEDQPTADVQRFAERWREFEPEQARRLMQAQESAVGNRTPQRRTADIPRSTGRPELAAEAPQRQQSQEVIPVDGEAIPVDDFAPTNRITSGEGSELPRRGSRPLEGQPVELPRPQSSVPRATPENIADLEARYEQMLRARYDKGAPLTGAMAGNEQALGAEIYRYRNEEAKAARGNRFSPDAEPGYTQQRPESPMTPEEKAKRRLAFQPRPRTSGLLQASKPGRPVTKETQIPSALDPTKDFYSREDARRGHFDTLTDDELVAEVRRLEDARANAIRGRSRLTPEEMDANRFDLKIAVEQQKERGRVQRAQGREPGERIANRTPGQKLRVIEHEQFGRVTESPNQKNVGTGKLRVTDASGAEHIVQNPRTRGGNRQATFVKAPQVAKPTQSSRGPAVDAPIAMEASRKPSAPRQQAQFEGESAEYTGKKDRYKRQAVYEIEMMEGRYKGQKRWIQTAPPKIEAAPAGNQFVRKMLQIKPSSRSGAPVEVGELRKQFPKMSKADFDAEISQLANDGKIAIHRHDYPQSLSEAERNKLVKIGDDYFIAATIREGRGHIMGMGLGSLQGMFKGRQAPKSNPTKADIEGASLGKAIGAVLRTGAQGLRTIKTSFDLSAPFGQAAFLTVPHPLKSARAFSKMMQSLSRTQSDAIDAEIAFHPLRKLGEDAGLYLATSAKLKGDASGGEEAFMLQGLNRVPGLGASERTYRTYLDTLRMSVWEGYVKSLQADGYTWENNPKAYRDAAAGINIASGRGSIKKGGKIEKAMDLGGDILFSPRNFVAKFQRLDPVRYATLAPGARKLVLRDALTTFGVMLGTAALLKARGANISLDPEDDNFMVARLGDTRYDLTVGAKTQVQFLARMAMGAYREKTGEGNLPYKDPISVASGFMRNQLAPGLSLTIDALKGEDFKGEKFSDKSAGKIASETIAPMLVEDFYEAYEKEGKAGVAKALPAIVGARVNTYPDKAKPDWVSTPPELRAEQKKAGETRSILGPRKGLAGNKADDETPGQFAARKARADEWTTKYGGELVGSRAYQSATDEEKKAARAYLKEAIAKQSGEKRPSLYLLNPARILATIRQSEREKKRKAARAGM